MNERNRFWTLLSLLFAAGGCDATMAGDGGMGGDMPAVVVDLATIDLAPPPDLTPPPDLAIPPDMARCTADSDCRDPALSRCDVSTGRCEPCLPAGDNCPPGRFCSEVNGATRYACADGCSRDSDCAADGGTSLCCDHVCVDVMTSDKNCGACNNACNNAKCCGGACIDLTMSLANCGACGTACTVANGTPNCTNSACGIASCTAPFKDCKNGYADGCETNTSNDVNNCGLCLNKCTVANGTASCANSTCGIAACSAGFKDCKNGYSDGCETSILTDPANCGACGTVCASGVCSNGVCLYAPSGVQVSVPVASLTGWSQCYLDTYSVDLPISQVVNTNCTKARLMMACRATGANTLDVVAWAPRTDVLFDTGTSNTPHNANNVGWYYNNAWSWGFAPQGDAINRFVCDNVTVTDNNLRLCWHTGQMGGGYRCGTNRALNNSVAFERIVYQAD